MFESIFGSSSNVAHGITWADSVMMTVSVRPCVCIVVCTVQSFQNDSSANEPPNLEYRHYIDALFFSILIGKYVDSE